MNNTIVFCESLAYFSLITGDNKHLRCFVLDKCMFLPENSFFLPVIFVISNLHLHVDPDFVKHYIKVIRYISTELALNFSNTSVDDRLSVFKYNAVSSSCLMVYCSILM